ncbi:DUF4190 domain-containing protein [Actinomycetospora soli]|uniref:DUF4190 domain-containing protein n=1 Tax=Actinomycetospora soli TaxID=2893887 RepID=UPI001E56947D|nr:DUF4190 domain-containing protein [Actinomycetospora soli]MCD2191562.1 DUF4190 domain-containing protein [Actinomycetospora soli]
MTDLHDGTRAAGNLEDDAEKTAPIRIPAQFRQAPAIAPLRPQQARPMPPQGAMPPPPVAPTAARNGFGITALCLGIVSLVFMLIPLTGFIAVILGALALIFGISGWSRARRGQATNGKMAVTGSALGALGLIVGIIGVVIMFQATAQLNDALDQLGTPSSSSTPYVGGPAAPERPAATSYTYEVTGNYRATQLTYTASNGDSASFNDNGTTSSGSKLPWSETVTPEPNGNYQSLNASTLSSKGDSWITCTIKDNTGAVIATDTGRGAYAGCYASTPFN